MPRYVAFLRAVNVGGRRHVPMARLQAELEGLGFSSVSTFLNSGNAIFEAKGSAAALVAAIEARRMKAFAFEVPTLLRSASEVDALATRRPFGVIRPGQTHMVALLRKAPSPTGKGAVEAMKTDRDRIVVVGRDVHWLIDGKTSDSKLKAKDWAAFGAEVSTTRNATMLIKLAAKLGAA